MAVITGQQQLPEERSDQALATRAPSSTGRASVEVAGVLTLLLGMWGAIVPYVGPVFGYSADGTSSWTLTTAHTWLFLVPGVVAAFGGLLMIAGGAASVGLARLGGLLAVVAGAWFVIGPIAWPLLDQGTFFRSPVTLQTFDDWVGYSMGPGVLLVLLGGFVMGRSRRAVVSPSTTY